MRFPSLPSLIALLLATALADLGAAADYELGPEDVVHVVVLGQPEMSGDFTIDREGMLSYPLLGRVKAAGLAPADVERKLATLLADGFLKKPQVSLTVKEMRSQRVFVTGEVMKPGQYSLRGDRSVRTILADVGPLTNDAGHEVVVLRPVGSEALSDPQPLDLRAEMDSRSESAAEIFRLGIRDVRGGAPDKNMVLRAGDTVQVTRAAQIYITGQVARQGSYRFEEGTTVLQALTVAGGVTERGSNKRVKIVRLVDGQPVELKAQLSDVVLPGDTIMVPERFF